MSVKETNSTPFLELSLENLADLQTSDLPIEKILNIWVNLTKSSSIIKNGKRLENISWRIVNRALVIEKNKSLKKEIDQNDFKTLIEVNLKANQQQNQLSKKLDSKRGSFSENVKTNIPGPTSFSSSLTKKKQLPVTKSASLFTHNAKLAKKNQSPSNINFQNSNEITQEITDSEDDSFIDSSSDEDSNVKASADDYDQPDPKYAFGYIDNTRRASITDVEVKSEQDPENESPASRPELNRSTSIVRGFSPNKISISYSSTNIAKTHPHHHHHEIMDHQQQTEDSVLETTEHVPSTVRQHERSKTVQPTVLSVPPSNAASSNISTTTKSSKSSSSISPKSNSTSDVQKRRVNVLTNLGMTSLPKQKDVSKNIAASLTITASNNLTPERRNMFFIESSPSPAESDLVGSIDNALERRYKLSQRQENHSKSKSQKRPKSKDGQSVPHTRSNSNVDQDPDKESIQPKRSDSLFGIKHQEVMYSSDESLSNDSEWSSVSESDISDDEECGSSSKQDVLHFEKKDEQPPKPSIKRSLLSGLFLNEMNQQLARHERQKSTSDLTNERVQLGTGLRSNTISPVLQQSLFKPRLVRSSTIGFINQSDTKVMSKENKSSIDLSSSANRKSIVGLSDIVATAQINHHDAKGELHKQSNKYSSSFDTKRSSLQNMISKSALNLTTYFSGKRVSNTGSQTTERLESLETDNGNSHKSNGMKNSNAPATASTLLPTALATHMFLPNAHQKAKSQLTSVLEDEDDDDDDIYQESNNTSNSNQNLNSSSISNNTSNSNSNKNISSTSISKSINIKPMTYSYYEAPLEPTMTGALSPKTTRRNMLQTELSESLRKSLLTDHKLGKIPMVDKSKEIMVALEQKDEWDDDNMNYHARGW